GVRSSCITNPQPATSPTAIAATPTALMPVSIREMPKISPSSATANSAMPSRSSRRVARTVLGTYRQVMTNPNAAINGTTKKHARQLIACASIPLTAGSGVATAYPTPKYAAIAAARRPGGNTALVIASDRPIRNASVTPTPARATINTAATGAAAASALNTIAPHNPTRYIRRMPYRSPSAPADSTAAAMVRVARLAMKVEVLPVIDRPLETTCRLADKAVGSPIEIA